MRKVSLSIIVSSSQTTKTYKIKSLLQNFEESLKFLINESIEKFITDLKDKVCLCELGGFKHELTNNIFTCGLVSDILQEKLLQDDWIDWIWKLQ